MKSINLDQWLENINHFLKTKIPKGRTNTNYV